MIGDPSELRAAGPPVHVRAVVLAALLAAASALGLTAAQPLAAQTLAEPRLAQSGFAGADGMETALITRVNASLRAADGLPRVLSAADVVRYRRIFAHQARQDWDAAGREADKLQDPLLLGHVLFERYMHPTAYRSKYPELHFWLDAYADHPGAYRLYRLALKRRLSGWRAPRKPASERGRAALIGGSCAAPVVAASAGPPETGRSKAQARMARRLQNKIARYLRRGRVSAAEELLSHKQVVRVLHETELDAARVKVAAAHYYAGRDAKALELAALAARSAGRVPLANWTAGLAAWRMGRTEAARAHFEVLAHSTTASGWNVAAGAYWAARASPASEGKAERKRLLELAVLHPRTFYGLLAARVLATDTPFSWREPPLAPRESARLMEMAGIRRAVALRRVGRLDLAQQEIEAICRAADRALAPALLALASRLEMPAVQLRLGRTSLAPECPYYDGAIYPLSPWEPGDGFAVDRALVHAFMRQESGFSNRAKSRKGARGLMQLMPRTASYLAEDKSLRGRNKQRLFSPEFNIDLGQRYLARLMESERVRGNLLLLAAAYNAGPGTLAKWLESVRFEDDPLLFMESVPLLETRLFMERVLANFWIYRDRLRQDSPSLDAVANGNWPYYLSLDRRLVTVASNDTR